MGVGELAVLVLQNLPGLIKAGQDISAILSTTNDVIATAQAQQRDPYPAEWDAINGQIAALEAQIDAAG